MEVMRLRVKDLDFTNRQIIVRDGKGENDRVTMFGGDSKVTEFFNDLSQRLCVSVRGLGGTSQVEVNLNALSAGVPDSAET